jgi:hypothetical protein
MQAMLQEGGYLCTPPSLGRDNSGDQPGGFPPDPTLPSSDLLKLGDGGHLSEGMYVALLQGIDSDGDGQLSFAEFCGLMTSKELVSRVHPFNTG